MLPRVLPPLSPGSTFFYGARFVYVEHPELARLWLPPVLVTFGLLVTAGWFAIDVHDQVTQWLWSTPSGEGVLAGALRFLHVLLEWVVAFALFAAGFVAVALVSGVIAAPFNDALSEAVECLVHAAQCTALQPGAAAARRRRSVGLAVLKLGAYAA